MSNEDLKGEPNSADAEPFAEEDAQIAAAIRLAESDHQSQHPVVTLLDSLDPEAFNSISDASKSMSTIERDVFERHNLSFLADSLVELGDISLTLEDIFIIWAKVVRVFSCDSHRYKFASLLMSAYAVQQLPAEAWKRFPRQFFETRTIPEAMLQNMQDLQKFLAKISELFLKINLIYRFVKRAPVKPNPIQPLIDRALSGDPEAQAEYLQYLDGLGPNGSQPLYHIICENFNNAIGFVEPLQRVLPKDS